MKHSSSSRRGRSRGNGKRHPSQKNNFESNGPDVKIRGTAQQVLEKYLALGRDATLSGDRVSAEAYFQHAEHYYRVISNAEAQNPNRPQQPRGRGTPQNGGHPSDTGEFDSDEDNPDSNTNPQAKQTVEVVDIAAQPAPSAPSAPQRPDIGPIAGSKGDSDTGATQEAAPPDSGSADAKPRAPRRRGPGRPRRPKNDTGGEPPKEPASA